MTTKLKTYGERATSLPNKTAQELLTLMERKKSNLAVALDVTTKQEFLDIADKVGPYICCLKVSHIQIPSSIIDSLKCLRIYFDVINIWLQESLKDYRRVPKMTHIDILEDFDQDLIDKLKKLQKKHDFIIFEDRKFADIGNTVKHQYSKGIYKIAEWADIVDAHAIPGDGIITGLKEIGLPLNRGLLLLAEMSSKGNLATGAYTEATIEMAKRHKDFVIGFISGKKFNSCEELIIMTPGISLDISNDDLGQQYKTPRNVIENGSDIIIVGRGIYGKGKDAVVEAQRYRNAGWEAYLEKLE